MTLNDKYCKLLDFDFGYDNQALADKIEKTSDEFAIGFSEYVNKIRTYKSKIYCLNSYEELLEMYKIEKGLKQQE